ncbi:sensor histidine kinase [Methylococcus capsulatus]|uniref:sensor histidine kinase n=1 Tax=Methylococcus capsulatus TaxID=414 RepID=UPI001C52BAA7|nr:ATP-binding protein [Methylococcus capsulatus]QXP87090.1 HAMP domain-containing histidine kinase [Methylococcus capsulatus]QXP93230.1 HAMP domain-containing histidine kinase [Methylococcus capsulatus]UQN12075.1 HAMP domain-containing histidine kinase [Methylococcus capsulatus]
MILGLRARLILVHLAVVVIVLACSAAGAYWMLRQAVHSRLDAALLALAETERAMLLEGGEQSIKIHEAAPGPAPPSFIRLDRLVQIVDGDGRVLARSANLGTARLPSPPGLLLRLSRGETVFDTLPAFGEEPVRMVSIPVRKDGSRLAIQVAGSLDDARNVMKSAGLLFIVLTSVLLVAVGIAGTSLTRRAFHAIDEVVRQARRIGEANLGERLPHPGSRDEIGRLVDTLNEMLGRLERSFEVQRRFTADASHELRSPLSRLRAELEITLRRPRRPDEYKRTLHSCLEEVERLTQLVEALLELARLDAQQEAVPGENVCLNTVLAEVVRRQQPLAQERSIGIVVETSQPVTAWVSGASIGVAFSNVLENALKFSPPGGTVHIGLAADAREAVVSICDNGPGIEPGEKDRLFERFFRGSVARSGAMPGTGLGLALSQALVRHCGGTIEVTNIPEGGARFTIRLPLGP